MGNQGAANAAGTGVHSADAERRHGSILVVDDHEQNRELACLHLETEGYAVRTADSGLAALHAFEAQPADLVLLDVMMPGLDGFETCERLRALPGGADAAVVFLTSLADTSTHARALDSGGDEFLNKPIARTELLLRVRSLLRIQRMQEELRNNYALIREQRDALVEAQRTREQTTALVVHDMKSPLAAIVMSTEFVRSGRYTAQEHDECLSDILSAAHRLNRMVLNLLDVSRSESGSLTLRPTPIRLEELKPDIEQEFGRRVEQRRQRMRLGPMPDHPVLADRELLARLLANLVENALKYSPDGGTIDVSAREVEGGFVEIRVRDQGRGVPPTHRERIFERYVRLDEDADAGRTSRGLGLTSCRVAAEALGGRIWVEDGEPRGSVFCVSLPGT